MTAENNSLRVAQLSDPSSIGTSSASSKTICRNESIPGPKLIIIANLRKEYRLIFDLIASCRVSCKHLNPAIAKQLDLAESMVERGIRELKENHLIKFKGQGKRRILWLDLNESQLAQLAKNSHELPQNHAAGVGAARTLGSDSYEPTHAALRELPPKDIPIDKFLISNTLIDTNQKDNIHNNNIVNKDITPRTIPIDNTNTGTPAKHTELPQDLTPVPATKQELTIKEINEMLDNKISAWTRVDGKWIPPGIDEVDKCIMKKYYQERLYYYKLVHNNKASEKMKRAFKLEALRTPNYRLVNLYKIGCMRMVIKFICQEVRGTHSFPTREAEGILFEIALKSRIRITEVLDRFTEAFKADSNLTFIKFLQKVVQNVKLMEVDIAKTDSLVIQRLDYDGLTEAQVREGFGEKMRQLPSDIVFRIGKSNTDRIKLFEQLHRRPETNGELTEFLHGSRELSADQLPEYFRRQRATVEAEIAVIELGKIQLNARRDSKAIKDLLVKYSLKYGECLSVPAKVEAFVMARVGEDGTHSNIKPNIKNLIADEMWKMRDIDLWLMNLSLQTQQNDDSENNAPVTDTMEFSHTFTQEMK